MYDHLKKCDGVKAAEAALQSHSAPSTVAFYPTPATLRTNVADAFVSANVSNRATEDPFVAVFISEVQVRV